MPIPTPRHLLLVLNGKAAGDDAVRAAVAAARDAGNRVDVRVTWEAGDAERYVAEAIAGGIQTVVAGGGDGTLSEVATTLAHRAEAAAALPTLALLPLGTANDFATAAGIPDSPEAALRLACEAPAAPIDLLRLEAGGTLHWAANLATGGFGTEVTTETHEGLKKLLGGLAYVLTGLSKVGRIEPQAVRLHGPGFDWEGDFIALGIGNGRQAGGGQALCPQALVDDGLLDVTLVPPLDGEVLGTLGTAMAEGKVAALERVAVRRALPWVEITSDAPLTLNLDGEPVQAMTFRIECMPSRVRMHLPPDCPLLANPATVAP